MMISAKNLGIPIDEVGDAYTMSWMESCRSRRRKYSVDARRRVSGRKKWEPTDSQMRRMQELRQLDYSWKKIAAIIGIAEVTIHRWKRRSGFSQ